MGNSASVQTSEGGNDASLNANERNFNASLDAVKKSIAELHEQLASASPHSEIHEMLIAKTSIWIERKKQLENLRSEYLAQTNKVTAEIEAKLKKMKEELKGEKKELLANIDHKFEDKAKELPELRTIVIPHFSTRVGTLELVIRHMKRYANDFKAVPKEMNFFHAAACSHWEKYVTTTYEDRFDILNNKLWSQANLPDDTKYPLTLADVDRIIHLPSYNEQIFVVLDTSLRVILTNAGYSEEQPYRYLVVYDSITHKFAPISMKNRNKKYFCRKCFRYVPKPCSCQSRLCPICLRTGDDFKCLSSAVTIVGLKPSHFLICPKCNAHCQTYDCFRAHKKVCPRPVSGLHDDIVEFLRSIAV